MSKTYAAPAPLQPSSIGYGSSPLTTVVEQPASFEAPTTMVGFRNAVVPSAIATALPKLSPSLALGALRCATHTHVPLVL